MSTIEVMATVQLVEDIVLATHDDVPYPPIIFMLANGDEAKVTMEMQSAVIRAHAKATDPSWYVNTRVETLALSLQVNNVSIDDLDRLSARHPSAKICRAHFETETGPLDLHFQPAPELGERVVEGIRDAVNTVLKFVRVNYGQHWLQLLSDDKEPIQNFLNRVRAKWRDANRPWKPLAVDLPVASLGPMYLGGRRLYLEPADWTAIQNGITGHASPLDGFALLSDARERYQQGDKQVAIIHLNSALEWAVSVFLRDKLGPKIPGESLAELMKQSHGRLLEDWVLPLSRTEGLALENNEWPHIKEIQKLRREAGHPTLTNKIREITEVDFRRLIRNATQAISKLVTHAAPKLPLIMHGTVQSGNA